jgi:hypothetical protein
MTARVQGGIARGQVHLDRMTLRAHALGQRGVNTMEDQPSSAQEPWWVGKAKRHHILLKFVIICVIIALLILALVVAVET